MMTNQNRLIAPILRMPHWLLGLIIAAAVILGTFYLVMHQVNKILVQESHILSHRTIILNKYLSSSERIVDAMVNTVKTTYLNEIHTPSDPVALTFLHDYPQYNSFGISAFSKDGGTESLSATLTGQGNSTRIDKSLRSEIIAVLAIDSQIGTQTSASSSYIWAYYTSVKHFVFLAPKLTIDDFQFTTDLYTKAYWTHTIPSANPDLKTLVSPLYEDAGGQGFMVTVSSPVVADNTFLGVASIDIGIKTLINFLTMDEAIGESFLVRTNGNIIAKPNNNTKAESIEFDLNQYQNKPTKAFGKWWIIEPIAGQDIVVVHQLNEKAVYIAALHQSSTMWMLLILMLGLFYSLLRLKQALIKITDIAHIDQLSSLLNRRGFRDSVEQVFDLNTRIHAPWVILMIDIDHFKRINDKFGHEAGDKIIIAMSNVLQNNIRVSDLACRWGGEEFVIFFYNTNLDDGYKLAEKFRQEISSLVKTPDQKSVTVSMGIAEATHKETIDVVIERSDRCLYFAKHTGRDRISARSKY